MRARSGVIAIALVGCSEPFASLDPVVDAGGDSSLDSSSADAGTLDAASDHETHGDGGVCETVGRTGAADTCKLFAYCGHRHFEVDCTARFTCICSEPEVDGGATKQIVAHPTYCESPAADMNAAFEAARRACGW
jgi:hypothetical protein